MRLTVALLSWRRNQVAIKLPSCQHDDVLEKREREIIQIPA